MKIIERLNSQRDSEYSAYYGLTKFSDLSPIEFMEHKLQASLSKRVHKHHGHRVSAAYRHHSNHLTNNHVRRRSIGGESLPDKIDW